MAGHKESDAAWAELLEETNKEKEKFKSRVDKILELSMSSGDSAKKKNRKGAKKSTKKKKQEESPSSGIRAGRFTEAIVLPPKPPEEAIAAALKAAVNLADKDAGVRRRAMVALVAALCPELGTTGAAPLSDEAVEEVFAGERLVAKSIFQRFSDPVEKVRELAFRAAARGFRAAADAVPLLPYFFPALAARAPPAAYDYEQQVFVHDPAAHAAHARGKAVPRVDKAGTGTFAYLEPSEEVRLAALRALAALFGAAAARGAASVLHPYFEEAAVFAMSHFRDPYPEVKIETCAFFQMLACEPAYQPGLKHYALGCARALLPALRHRLARVRRAAVDALGPVAACPKPEKQRGAGTDVIQELVGYREENVIPIAAFYEGEVNVNYLAELAQDRNPLVRERTVHMISGWLVHLQDRRDWESRLTPYLLDFLCDDTSAVRDAAFATLRACGKDYEQEHHDDIIDKIQYGVDGDERLNYGKKLPFPFKERPGLGARLFVRATARRFLRPLLGELTSWVSRVRAQGARLLRTLLVFLEEALTMEAHQFLPALMKAVEVASDPGADREEAAVRGTLLECAELAGRFLLPDAYVEVALRRARGERTAPGTGGGLASQLAALATLAAMLEGSKPSQVLLHLETLVNELTGPAVLGGGGGPQGGGGAGALARGALGAVGALARAVGGGGRAAVEAHFLATGRLKSVQAIFSTTARFLLVCRGHKDMQKEADEALVLVATLCSLTDIRQLVCHYQHSLENYTIENYPLGAAWSEDDPCHTLLLQFYEYHVVSAKLLVLMKDILIHSGSLQHELKCSLLEDLASRCIEKILVKDFFENVLTGDEPQSYISSLWGILGQGAWGTDHTHSLKRAELLQNFIENIVPMSPGDHNDKVIQTQGIEDTFQNAELYLSSSTCPPEGQVAMLGALGGALDLSVGGRRLRPFARRRRRGGDAEAGGDGGGGDGGGDGGGGGGGPARRADGALATPPRALFHAVLAALDSSQDPVRIAAAACMCSLLHFAVPDDHCASEEEVSAAPQYSPLVDNLLARVNVGAPSEPFLAQLDTALRVAAVLDPAAFLAAVRARNQGDARCNAYENLIEHGEMLQMFSSG